MKSNILVINGHPDPESYCAALSRAYTEGASSSAQVRLLDLSRVGFDSNLRHGYRQRTPLEPELVEAQNMIRQADHIVLVYPLWWGSMPAILKGFFDRVLLPGFAFAYRKDSSLWDKLLKGKTAHLIVTSDTPSWYNWLVNRRAGQRIMKHNILGFCGIRTSRVTEIGPVKPSTAEQRADWLDKVKRLGSKGV